MVTNLSDNVEWVFLFLSVNIYRKSALLCQRTRINSVFITVPHRINKTIFVMTIWQITEALIRLSIN